MKLDELTKELTREELLELEMAADKLIAFDEDCPEMTEEMLMQFRRVNKEEWYKTKQ